MIPGIFLVLPDGGLVRPAVRQPGLCSIPQQKKQQQTEAVSSEAIPGDNVHDISWP